MAERTKARPIWGWEQVEFRAPTGPADRRRSNEMVRQGPRHPNLAFMGGHPDGLAVVVPVVAPQLRPQLELRRPLADATNVSEVFQGTAHVWRALG